MEFYLVCALRMVNCGPLSLSCSSRTMNHLEWSVRSGWVSLVINNSSAAREFLKREVQILRGRCNMLIRLCQGSLLVSAVLYKTFSLAKNSLTENENFRIVFLGRQVNCLVCSYVTHVKFCVEFHKPASELTQNDLY